MDGARRRRPGADRAARLRSLAGLEPRADRPEVGERRLEERRAQVRDAGRAAGARLRRRSCARPSSRAGSATPGRPRRGRPAARRPAPVADRCGRPRPGRPARRVGRRRERLRASRDRSARKRNVVAGCGPRHGGASIRSRPGPARVVGEHAGASRRPSTASSSRNWADWKPLARSSRPRKLANASGVIVSRTSTWATTVFRIVRMRFSVASAVRGVAGLERPLEVRRLVEEHLEPELVDLVDDDEEQLVVLGPVRQRLLARQELVQVQVGGVGERRVLHGRPTIVVNSRA